MPSPCCPGWRESRGARVEYLLAREMGLDVLDAETLLPLADAPGGRGLLAVPAQRRVADRVHPDEAQRLTGGARQSDYGHPGEDFARTAAMWTGILAGKLREGEEVDGRWTCRCA